MSDQPVVSGSTLDLALPAIPPRSRLYHLSPRGRGSSEVESLTSYLTRLAQAHCVPVTKLAELEIAPLLHKNGTLTSTKFSNGAKNLNGWSDWTAMALTALQTLTRVEGLRALTMYPWRQVLAREKLLRPHLAWCSSCYDVWRQSEQPVYNPLLWHLDAVEICPRHQQPLCHCCPHPDCRRQLPLVNNRGQPGYCPFCQRWLGVTGGQAQAPEVDWPWQLWLTKQLAPLFSTAADLPADPSPQTLACNLATCLASASGTNDVIGLARQVGISGGVIYGCLNHAQPIRLDLLARICYHLGQSLLDLLTTRADPAQVPLRRTRPQLDIEALRQKLDPFLSEMPPCPAQQVARQLGVNSSVIHLHFPTQYQQLVERYEQYRQRLLRDRNDQLTDQLQAFLHSEKTPPPTLRDICRQLQMKPSTLTGACPELCRLITQRHRAYRQARKTKAEAGLAQILAGDEAPPPSVIEAAARLGEDIKYLYKCFPELCRQITQRRSAYRPTPRVKGQPKDHPAIRRQFMAILAQAETPPPSLREVARRLDCSATTLRQNHTALCDQLKQQTTAFYQAQITDLPARLADIVAANETPAPSLRAVSHRLGVESHLLKKICPDLCYEILQRAQTERQATKAQRKAVLDQCLIPSDSPPPALAQVARSLNTSDAGLAEQFPEEGTRLVQRYQAYKAAEKQSWQSALQAALAVEQNLPPTVTQVARQLGHPDSKKLRFHFPQLCRQLGQQRQTYLANYRHTLQIRLEAILAESQSGPPPTLLAVARRLDCLETTLKRLCPEQTQALLEQRQQFFEAKKSAAEQTLRAILTDEAEPPALKILAQDVGFSYDILRHHFPDLMAALLTKRQTAIKTRNQQRQQQLVETVKAITRELHQQGLNPNLYQVGLRLPQPKMLIMPELRQAWLETRRELGLPT